MHETKVSSRSSSSRPGVKSGSSRESIGSNSSNNSVINSSNSNNNNNISNSSTNKKKRHDDANAASTMSNLSSYSLIDDDHIDDQETINVGNLIIDLESDLEKEKQENEQAGCGNGNKTNVCSTTSPAGNAAANIIPSSTTSAPIAGPASSTTYPSKSNNGVAGSSPSSTTSKSKSKHANNIASSAVHNQPDSNATNVNYHNNARAVFKSSSDERGELKMKITREKPGKSELKIVSPNQKSPTSSNANPVEAQMVCDDSDSAEAGAKTIPASSISSTKECGTSTSIGTSTEPDCLGPCEPGTSVTLEGIVWQETDPGILVVNVTWRGKTYVGALLDCTRHDWAPPRLCDSPASDIDTKASKGARPKRIVTRSNGIGLDEKNLLPSTGKLRNGKGRRILNNSDLAPCNKRQREADKSTNELATKSSDPTMDVDAGPVVNPEAPSQNDAEQSALEEPSLDKAGSASPNLIGCKEPNCLKKYRNIDGLLYHQAHAHAPEHESSSATITEQRTTPPSKNEEPEKLEQAHDQMSSKQAHSPKARQPEIDSKSDLREPVADTERRSLSPKLERKQITEGNRLFQSHTNDINHPHQSISSKEPAMFVDMHRHNLLQNQHITKQEHERKSPDLARQNFETPSKPNQNNPHASQAGPSLPNLPNPNSVGPKPHTHQPVAQPPLPPVTSEEGMKPSGTSTGPPPAPHQANYYFNSAFLANSLNPYSLSPYLPKPGLPMYDPLMPQTSSANAAFLSRIMGNIRVPPPPDSPGSRLLSPSMPKNMPPFPPFSAGGPLSMPPSSLASSLPSLVNAPPMGPNMTQPPPATGPLHPHPSMPGANSSPHLRLPSQVDPMLQPPPHLPPTLPAFPPMPPNLGMNPALNPVGPQNPLGPLGGGPQVPSLVDDPLAKQFQRRFN